MEHVVYGGCIFCGEKGSGEHLKSYSNKNSINNICDSIQIQIDNYFKSERSKRAELYNLYFQNFTNTYDNIENLKKRYDYVLKYDNIKILSIATRPDCITEDICKLIASYKAHKDVWVELGLQTSNDEIAKFINRGYDSNTFTNAVKLLNKYNINIITHIMIGLPNETTNDIKNLIAFLNNHNIQGLKIHSCYIIKNTKLCDLYKNKEYTPPTLDYYIKNACYILTHINPKIVIHKISGDAPKNLLVAPDWNLHKKWILNGIDKYLRENNLYQGIYYKK